MLIGGFPSLIVFHCVIYSIKTNDVGTRGVIFKNNSNTLNAMRRENVRSCIHRKNLIRREFRVIITMNTVVQRRKRNWYVDSKKSPCSTRAVFRIFGAKRRDKYWTVAQMLHILSWISLLFFDQLPTYCMCTCNYDRRSRINILSAIVKFYWMIVEWGISRYSRSICDSS